MSADPAPRCPRCGGEDTILVREQTCHERKAKDGVLTGLPKARSTTSIYGCRDCRLEFAVTVDAE